jgi:hypothetical protein
MDWDNGYARAQASYDRMEPPEAKVLMYCDCCEAEICEGDTYIEVGSVDVKRYCDSCCTSRIAGYDD